MPDEVVDYTERARKVIALVENCAVDTALLVGAIAAEFSAVASERDAAQQVREEIAYWAGANDKRAALLARLQKPDVREEVIEALRNARWPSKKLPPLDELAPGVRKMYEREIGAIIARIAEMLK